MAAIVSCRTTMVPLVLSSIWFLWSSTDAFTTNVPSNVGMQQHHSAVAVGRTSSSSMPRSSPLPSPFSLTDPSFRHPSFLSSSTTASPDRAVGAKSEDLSLPARPGRPLKVMIAGGGVGGLTAALCMLKKGFHVEVYEKTAAFARFGGPIQFASNALSVLRTIDEGLFERIMDKFTFTATRTCGIKDGLRAGRGVGVTENDKPSLFRMTDDFSWDYIFNKDSPADWFVKFPLRGCADLFGLPYTGVIDRPDLQEILIDECRKYGSGTTENGAKFELYNGSPVVDYTTLGNGNGVDAVLSDGRIVHGDVLVGADGIWSAVRAKMYGEEIKKTSANGKRRQGCSYSGYTVFAGETVLETPDYYETGYKVYIGPKRYFVTSDVGDGRVQWYAFFAFPPGSKRAPSGWGGSESARDSGESEENLVEYIRSLHEGWSEEVGTVLDATRPESVEQRDLYDRAPEFLRGWTDGNVCLLGDAVHPMMPNLGQGGCQAIEDAYVLTEALAGCKSTAKIEETLQNDYFRQRILRVSMVQFLSRLASDLIVNAFDTPWSPHDDLGRSWKSYLTFAWKPLLKTVIFPLQFAFLYSYYPSGSMAETAKQLETIWRDRHRESSEEAFARARSDDFVADIRPSFFQKAEEEEPVAA